MYEVGDWVMNRPHGVGRVVAVDGRDLTVQFRHGLQTVTKNTRRLANDGLDVRAHLNPAELRTRLNHDALGVAIEVIREAPDGRSAEQIRRRVVSLGVEPEAVEKWWIGVEPQLRQNPDSVDRDEDRDLWAPKRATTAESSPQELLERLGQKRLRSELRTKICSQLAELALGGLLSAGETAAAAALGCQGLSPAPSLADVDPRELSTSLVELLVEKAGETDMGFLVRTALAAKSEQAAAQAAKRAHELFRETQLTAEVSRYLDNERDTLRSGKAQPADAAALLTKVVVRAERLAAGGATPRLVAAVIGLHLASQQVTSDAKEFGALRTAVDRLLEISGASAEIVERAAAAEPIRSATDRAIARVLVTLSISRGSSRLAFLDGLRRAGRHTAVLVPEAWQGLKVGSLARIMHEPVVRELLLGTAAGRQIVEGMLSQELGGMNKEVLATLVQYPAIVEYCPPEALDGYLSALAMRESGVRRLGEGLVRPLLSEAEASARQVVARLEERHNALVAQGEAERNQMAEQVARLGQQLEYTQARLRRTVTEADSTSQAELRQARIDGLRAAVDLLGELERHTGKDSQIVATLLSTADLHGLRRLSTPGQVERFSADMHRVIGGDPTDDVLVVESGWAADLGDGRAVLKHALVRRVERG